MGEPGLGRHRTRWPHALRRAGFALTGAAALLICASPAGAAGDRALGEYLAGECTGCHQLAGRSSGGIPPIIGWPEEQFVAALDAYGRKQRGSTTMQTIAARLSRDEMTALAAYFGALAAKP